MDFRTCKLHFHSRFLAWFAYSLLLQQNNLDSLYHHHEVFTTPQYRYQGLVRAPKPYNDSKKVISALWRRGARQSYNIAR